MYPVPFRQAVLLAYTHLRSLRKTAKLFALAVSTVRRWLIRLHPHKWPERTRTDVMEFIVSLVKSNPFITTQNVCTKVRDVFCFSVSRKLVCLVLKREGITFKRARHGVAPSVAQLDNMPEFCTLFEQSRPNLICIDETNVSHKALSLYGWSRKGDRLKTNKATKSWTSKTLVMACSENQYHSQLLSTACNSQKYAAFIESLPFPPGSVILMDNVAFHKSSTVRDMLLSKEYTALYTPPYTPDANPVVYFQGSRANSALCAPKTTSHLTKQCKRQSNMFIGTPNFFQPLTTMLCRVLKSSAMPCNCFMERLLCSWTPCSWTLVPGHCSMTLSAT